MTLEGLWLHLYIRLSVSLSFQYHLHCLVWCFSYNMVPAGSFLVLSVWCSKRLPVPGVHLCLYIWEALHYYFVEYILYAFRLKFFCHPRLVNVIF